MGELSHKLYIVDGDVIRGVDDASDVVGFLDGSNPLSSDWKIPAQVAANQRLVAWSGTLSGSDDLFVPFPHNWLKHGREALDAFCDKVTPELKRRHVQLAIRPHARHVLSDPASTLSFLNARLGEPFGLALDPISLLEPTMLPVVEEHLERIFEMLGGRAELVILRRDSTVNTEILRRLMVTHIPVTTPIVFREKRFLESFFPGFRYHPGHG